MWPSKSRRDALARDFASPKINFGICFYFQGRWKSSALPIVQGQVGYGLAEALGYALG
jgi:hypothetical protein